MKDQERSGLRRGIAGQVAGALARGLPIHAQQIAETAVQVATAVVDQIAATEEREEQQKAEKARQEAAAKEEAAKKAASAAADTKAGGTTVEPH